MIPLAACGAAAVMAYAMIGTGVHRLGSPGFFGWTALAVAAYGAALAIVARRAPRRPLLLLIVGLAVLMRAPLVAAPVGPGSDMLRYVWDARVQRAGLSPYDVVPSDPAFAHLHTDETRAMNNRNIPSPYPPGAQLFFRLVTALHESTLAIKIALAVCDIGVILILVAWLPLLGRSPLWVVAYAWNPLAALETSYSGHLDAAGVLAVTAAAFALSRKQTLVSVTALACGVAVKFLPLVLIPLYWKRARPVHGVIGAGLLALLYLPFTDVAAGMLPVGSLSNMVQGFRFNGPLFQLFDLFVTPWTVAVLSVGAGMAVALWMRLRNVDEPAAWSWPMAAALLFSPVIHPWYLTWLAPFFLSRLTAPLVVWSVAILPVYVVWSGLFTDGTWAVPIWWLVIEYGALAGSTAWVIRRARATWGGAR